MADLRVTNLSDWETDLPLASVEEGYLTALGVNAVEVVEVWGFGQYDGVVGLGFAVAPTVEDAEDGQR